jgi:hypothetical protein
MRPKSTLDAGRADFSATGKPESTLCRAERTLKCDLKNEFDFRMPHGADFDMRLENQSRL